jgi:hypothetical protein
MSWTKEGTIAPADQEVDTYGNRKTRRRDETPGLFAAVGSGTGGGTGPQGPPGPQGPAGDPATNIITSVDGRTGVVTLTDLYQPIDSDLTAIAALSTTSFGRGLLALADAAAGRTALGLGTAATQASTAFDAAGAAAAAQSASQPLDSDLTAIAALTTTSFGRSFLALADAAAARTLTGALASSAVGAASGVAPLDASSRVPNANLPLVMIRPAVTLVDAATIATDASLGNTFRVALGADRILGTPTNPTDNQMVRWEITASGGARTLTLSAGFGFGSDITAITTTASGKTDVLGAVYNSAAALWWILAYVKGF